MTGKKDFMFIGRRNSWNSFAEYLIKTVDPGQRSRNNFWKHLSVVSKALVIVLLLEEMEKADKYDTILSEIKILIPLQVFFRFSLKKFLK